MSSSDLTQRGKLCRAAFNVTVLTINNHIFYVTQKEKQFVFCSIDGLEIKMSCTTFSLYCTTNCNIFNELFKASSLNKV